MGMCLEPTMNELHYRGNRKKLVLATEHLS